MFRLFAEQVIQDSGVYKVQGPERQLCFGSLVDALRYVVGDGAEASFGHSQQLVGLAFSFPFLRPDARLFVDYHDQFLQGVDGGQGFFQCCVGLHDMQQPGGSGRTKDYFV